MAGKTRIADVKNARVTVEIDGEDVILIPSPDAIITLSRAYDGFRPLLDAIGRFNVDAAMAVVVAGAGVEGKAARSLSDRVAKTSMVSLAAPLTAFVTILVNGGKPLSDGDDEEGEDKDPS